MPEPSSQGDFFARWRAESRPAPKLLSMLLVLLGGYLLANAIFPLLVSLVLGIPLATLVDILQNPARHDNAWSVIMLLQALVHLGSYTVVPLFYWFVIERRPLADLTPNPRLAPVPVLLAGTVLVMFIPFVDWLNYWNQSLHLPAALASTERWMRAQEAQMGQLTEMLTNFQSVPQWLVGVLVIAVIPAVGEELLFRGLLQNRLLALTRNPHAAVWLAAAVFSAVHIQFLGFFPRMALGAVFGYLYLWSGSLWLPVVAHFVNNAFLVTATYFYRAKLTEYDASDVSEVPLLAALPSLALTVVILLYLKNSFARGR